MSEDFGSDYITLIDDDGNETELEVLDVMDYNGKTYEAFLPADMDENDPDYGMIILHAIEGDDGDTTFEDIEDDGELNEVYERFMALLFDDDEETEEAK